MSPRQVRKLAGTMMFAILLSPAVSVADIYKWVDAQGRVHFGDTAPRDGRSTVTTLTKDDRQVTDHADDASPQVIQDRHQRLAEQLREERLQREEAAVREAQRKQKQQADCEYAKNRIAHMKTINVFYDVNPDGTVRYLSDKEGDKLRKQADQLYKQHCG